MFMFLGEGFIEEATRLKKEDLDKQQKLAAFASSCYPNHSKLKC